MNLYETLRSDILLGTYEPGSRLKMDALKQHYNSGVNVLRESLVRLTGEGLVDAEDQKGFRIASVSSDRLHDLIRMRILLELDGARQSFKQGDMNWESNLVAAHHKLAHIESKMRKDEQANLRLWSQCDYEFHAALIAACGSRLHQQWHKQIFDRFRQYVVIELKINGFRGNDIIEEHKAIMDAALARDVDACALALEQHFQVYTQRSMDA